MMRITKISLAIVLGLVLFGLSSHSTSALSTSQFNPGNIIDDSVFFNASALSIGEIQSFMNAKLPSCDTNGTQQTSYYYNSTTGRVSFGSFSGGSYVQTTRAIYGQRYNSYTGRSDGGVPFTCLRDYSQATPSVAAEAGLCNAYTGGTKSSAQIIFDVSQACGINPQVLLVLLEKEQGLVTDVWPQGIQYQAATGYACPDTASCNPTYYGFFNQVFYGARQYKLYARNIDSYAYRPGRTVNIQFNPNTSCGSSPIYIQNQATANLYIYTPYQPNAAALAAPEGVVVDCGAYGNLNFWRRFNSWFGPSVGPLVRTTTSTDLYYSDGATKYRVGSMELAAEYGLGLGSVRFVSQAALDSLATASPNPNLSYLLKSSSDSDEDGGNIYLVSSGKRYLISSMTQFNAFGFTTDQIAYLEYSQLLRLPYTSSLSSFVRASDKNFVYQVSGGIKQGIFEGALFSSLNPSGTVTDLSAFLLSTIPTGRALIQNPTTLRSSDNKIWLATNSGWYSIPSMDVFTCMGLTVSRIIDFTSSQSTTDSSLGTGSCVVASSDGKSYLLDKTKRYVIHASWNFSAPTTSINESLLSLLTPITSLEGQVFKSPSTGSLYVLDTNKKRHIYNMTSFTNNNYSLANIVTVSDALLNVLPLGYYKYSDGFVLTNNTGPIYLLMNDSKLYINSMEQFTAFGLDSSDIIRSSTADVASYTTGPVLSQLFVIGSQSYFMDRGVVWSISDTIKSHYGVSVSTPSYTTPVISGKPVQTATRFVKSTSSPNVYYLENGQKRHLLSWDAIVARGGSTQTIMTISDYSLTVFTSGPSI